MILNIWCPGGTQWSLEFATVAPLGYFQYLHFYFWFPPIAHLCHPLESLILDSLQLGLKLAARKREVKLSALNLLRGCTGIEYTAFWSSWVRCKAHMDHHNHLFKEESLHSDVPDPHFIFLIGSHTGMDIIYALPSCAYVDWKFSNPAN